MGLQQRVESAVLATSACIDWLDMLLRTQQGWPHRAAWTVRSPLSLAARGHDSRSCLSRFCTSDTSTSEHAQLWRTESRCALQCMCRKAQQQHAYTCLITALRQESTPRRRTSVFTLSAVLSTCALSQSLLDHDPLMHNCIRKPQAHDASMRSLTGGICTLLVVFQGYCRAGSRSVTMCTADQFELGTAAPSG